MPSPQPASRRVSLPPTAAFRCAAVAIAVVAASTSSFAVAEPSAPSFLRPAGGRCFAFASGSTLSHRSDSSRLSSRPRALPPPGPVAAVASHPSLSSARAASSAESGGMPVVEGTEKEKEEAGEEVVSSATIAEMIEVSFVQSCLQLSAGYVDVLKLFLAAVKAGYDRGTPLSELVDLVERCDVKSAGRELADEEKALRNEWMAIAYRMLRELDFTFSSSAEGGAKKGDVEWDFTEGRVPQMVEAIMRVRRNTAEEEIRTGGKADAFAALKDLTVEQVLRNDPTLSSLMEKAEASGDAMEKALLTNGVRDTLTLITVLEEERVCFEDDDSGGMDPNANVPRPPIKGT